MANDKLFVSSWDRAPIKRVDLISKAVVSYNVDFQPYHLVATSSGAEVFVTDAQNDAIQHMIVADGTSCRHQISDGAGREARHLVEILADALG